MSDPWQQMSSDRTILKDERMFLSPCHQIMMRLVSYGAEPNTGETYGEWKCPVCEVHWFEHEEATEWELMSEVDDE